VVEFKAVIADPKTSKSYSKEVSGRHANALIGKKIGEEVDGIFVDLPGYKLVITGGSDRDGVPMRKDIPGSRRRPMLVTKGIGFHPEDKGVRKRRNVRGNTISPDIIQLNMRVISRGPKPIEDSLKAEEGEK
jgi:small subunit ribosomal protein S6e